MCVFVFVCVCVYVCVCMRACVCVCVYVCVRVFVRNSISNETLKLISLSKYNFTNLYFISSVIAYCISPYASFYAGLSCSNFKSFIIETNVAELFSGPVDPPFWSSRVGSGWVRSAFLRFFCRSGLVADSNTKYGWSF